jgi:hypothetical protein
VTAGLSYNRRQTSMGVHYFRGASGGSGVQTGTFSDGVSGSVGHPLGHNWMGSVSGSFTRSSELLSIQPISGETTPIGVNETFKTFYGGAQVTRALGRSWSCFGSYSAQNQSVDSTFVGQNVFSGFSQTFGFGITFAPRSTRLGEF